MTGPITGTGNVTSITSQTGTGTTFVMNTSPTLVTPVLGVATATSINGNIFTAGSSTYTGTAGQTYTFPSTNASIARTDAAQTFAGVQTFTGSIILGAIAAPSLNTTVTVSAPAGSTVVYSIPYATYTAGFFDYIISSTTNIRAGSIVYATDGTSVYNTETFTKNVGTTSNLTFTVTIVGANVVLTAVSSSGTWTVKTIVRAI